MRAVQGQDGLYIALDRPPTVPSEYLATPNGYFHPSCVHQVADDEAIDEHGRIARRDGTTRDVAPCTLPRYDFQGRVVTDDLAAISRPPGAEPLDAPTVNGWVEAAGSTAFGAVTYIHAQWNVPPAPTHNVGQVIYFFPGLEENTTSAQFILQPVLGWNQADSGIAGWSLASWNCCSIGSTYHSAAIAVTGTTVSGDIGGSGCNASGVCSAWQIVSLDWSSQHSTTFNTTAAGKSMKWTQGAVLEAYGVAACNEFPTSTVTFSAFDIRKANNTHITSPSWTNYYWSPTPSCSYSVTEPGSGKAVLHY